MSVIVMLIVNVVVLMVHRVVDVIVIVTLGQM